MNDGPNFQVPPWRYGSTPTFDANVFNIAAIAVFDRVLTDGEVRQVFNYYTGSLGIDIGL